jgi:hypothetical protein
MVERAKLFNDRMNTMDMLNPYGHDFYLGINAAITSDAISLLNDAKDLKTATTTTEVNTILSPYYNKEQAMRVKADIGVPLPSFSISNFNFTPDLKINAGLMTMLMPSSEKLTYTTLIDNLDMLDPALKDKLKSCLSPAPANGTDLLNPANGCVTADEAAYIKDTYGISEFKYDASVINGINEIPILEMYAKGEMKAGLDFKYETEDKHFFGNLGLNVLGRLDVYKYLDATLLIAGGGASDISNNLQAIASLDYKIGYRNTNYSIFTSVEEVKLAELSSKNTGIPVFGTDPLIRVHAQADYRLSIFKVSPFIGTHSRSGYGMGDAYYVGADWGMYVWNDRMGLNFRTMLDKEHATLGVRAKMWFFQTDVMAKIAVGNDVNGIKVNDIYTANIRFFF